MGETTWLEAARAGIDTLVHSDPDMIEPLGPRESDLPRGDFLRAWGKSVDPETSLEELAAALLAGGVELNPTLVNTEAKFWGDDPRALERLEPWRAPERDVPGWWGEGWRERQPYTAHWSHDDLLAAREVFPKILECFRLLHERGVLLTAGSDVGNPWITPGVSLHRELELLARAGIPNLGVITIATKNGAEALGLATVVGTVEPGKRADLVVLTADPLADIHNTRAIGAVYRGGRRLADPDSL